jgi:hypothetical protein
MLSAKHGGDMTTSPIPEPETIHAKLGKIVEHLEAVMRDKGISEEEIAAARRRGEEDADNA